jgi:hypothetical protein
MEVVVGFGQRKTPAIAARRGLKEKSAVQGVEEAQNDWAPESDPLNVVLVLPVGLRNGL